LVGFIFYPHFKSTNSICVTTNFLISSTFFYSNFSSSSLIFIFCVYFFLSRRVLLSCSSNCIPFYFFFATISHENYHTNDHSYGKNFNENLADFSLIYRLELFFLLAASDGALSLNNSHFKNFKLILNKKKIFFVFRFYSSEKKERKERNYYCFPRREISKKKEFNEERLLRSEMLLSRARERIWKIELNFLFFWPLPKKKERKTHKKIFSDIFTYNFQFSSSSSHVRECFFTPKNT
jgi:hypothetical protein